MLRLGSSTYLIFSFSQNTYGTHPFLHLQSTPGSLRTYRLTPEKMKKRLLISQTTKLFPFGRKKTSFIPAGKMRMSGGYPTQEPRSPKKGISNLVHLIYLFKWILFVFLCFACANPPSIFISCPGTFFSFFSPGPWIPINSLPGW